MITVYGIETEIQIDLKNIIKCWNDMITVYGIETVLHSMNCFLIYMLERYDYRLRY